MSRNIFSQFRSRRLTSTIATLLLVSLSGQVMAQEQQPAAKGDRATLAATVSLPNGATSINESYGDWNVSCAIADNRKSCAFSQSQGNSQTGQRVFAIELQPATADGQTNGMLLLPFGLKIDDGVKLKIDEQNLGQGARFSTCVPAGCLVPVLFPKTATDALKKGQKLIVTAVPDGPGEPAVFSAPLNGFAASMNRVAELAK
jgi:invasion protein IalB